MVLQQDFKERHAAAFMITKIRSFKRETIFFGGGGGGGAYSWYFTVCVIFLDAFLCVQPTNVL